MTDLDHFEWDSDFTIIKQVDAVAVYANPSGDAVIRQQHPMGDEDWWIVIPMERVPALIQALQNLVKEAANGNP